MDKDDPRYEATILIGNIFLANLAEIGLEAYVTNPLVAGLIRGAAYASAEQVCQRFNLPLDQNGEA